MWLCYCVLGFAAHSFISDIDSDCDDCYDDEDRYDAWGYGSDYEESTEDYYE